MSRFSLRALAAAGLIAAVSVAGPVASAQGPGAHTEVRYVKGDAVNVRGGPGTSYTVLEVAILGTEVTIYASNGNWSLISPPGKPERWIYAPLLQKEKPPVPQRAAQKAAPKKAEPQKAGPQKSEPKKAEPSKQQPDQGRGQDEKSSAPDKKPGGKH